MLQRRHALRRFVFDNVMTRRAAHPVASERAILEVRIRHLRFVNEFAIEIRRRPVIEFETDDRLGLGEFGIQTRVVQPENEHVEPERPESGRTMIYSGAERLAEPLEERARTRADTALLLIDGKRVVVGPAGVTLGRSRQCDVVLSDPNVSREHAEIRPRGGSWVLTDLGSTNGSQVNGRRIQGPEVIRPGDEIELGTSVMTFQVE